MKRYNRRGSINESDIYIYIHEGGRRERVYVCALPFLMVNRSVSTVLFMYDPFHWLVIYHRLFFWGERKIKLGGGEGFFIYARYFNSSF